MKRNALIIALAGVAIAVTAWKLVPAGTHTATNPALITAPTVATTTAPSGTAGYIVHLDGNGKLATEPETVSDAEFNAELEKQFNTSSEGLQMEKVPNGGVMVKLQGRFMTAMVATKGADGKVVVPCLTDENDVKAFEKAGAAAAAVKE